MAIPVANYILLADDDKDHGTLFERVLRKVDPAKKLSIVYDGDALLAMLSELIPEILFLDLRMPCRNGLECLQEIRNNPELNALKVVVYSSSTYMTDIQKCYIHKADLYMVKPFNAMHLGNALEAVLKKDTWQNASLQHHYYINNRFVPFTAHS